MSLILMTFYGVDKVSTSLFVIGKLILLLFSLFMFWGSLRLYRHTPQLTIQLDTRNSKKDSLIKTSSG